MMSLQVTINTTVILSLGTGANHYAIHGKYHSWGILRWAKHLIPLMFDATETSIELNMKMLLQERYCRLNQLLPESVPFPFFPSSSFLISAPLNLFFFFFFCLFGAGMWTWTTRTVWMT